VTKLEQLLGRVQRELGGQVGSFRLKGTRHRFTGRSSLVAFADGMHGGEFALKFYCDPEAAQTEFAIYRQATVRVACLPQCIFTRASYRACSPVVNPVHVGLLDACTTSCLDAQQSR
jgi:hypothetical protein